MNGSRRSPDLGRVTHYAFYLAKHRLQPPPHDWHGSETTVDPKNERGQGRPMRVDLGTAFAHAMLSALACATGRRSRLEHHGFFPGDSDEPAQREPLPLAHRALHQAPPNAPPAAARVFPSRNSDQRSVNSPLIRRSTLPESVM